MEAQAILTLAFNIICISYATLAGANFVLGLCEEWMKSTQHKDLEVKKESEVNLSSDVNIKGEQTVWEYNGDVIELISDTPKGWECVEPHNDVYYTEDTLCYTIRELKAMAKERRIPRYGNMRKQELILALFG